IYFHKVIHYAFSSSLFSVSYQDKPAFSASFCRYAPQADPESDHSESSKVGRWGPHFGIDSTRKAPTFMREAYPSALSTFNFGLFDSSHSPLRRECKPSHQTPCRSDTTSESHQPTGLFHWH